MEILEEYKDSFKSIRDLLISGQERLSHLKEQRYDTEKEKKLRSELLKEINSSLKPVLSSFFATYDKFSQAVQLEMQNWCTIGLIPSSKSNGSDDTSEDGEIETLRRIERLLERQNLSKKIEKMTDSEVVTLYENTVSKTERLRNSLIAKLDSGEISINEANTILKTDANVRIATMIEDEDLPLTSKQTLQNALNGMIRNNKQRRLNGFEHRSIKQSADKMLSSVNFLLRDITDMNLKIKDWEGSECIIEDIGSNQVNFFLSQSENILAVQEVQLKDAPENDILS